MSGVCIFIRTSLELFQIDRHTHTHTHNTHTCAPEAHNEHTHKKHTTHTQPKAKRRRLHALTNVVCALLKLNRKVWQRREDERQNEPNATEVFCSFDWGVDAYMHFCSPTHTNTYTTSHVHASTQARACTTLTTPRPPTNAPRHRCTGRPAEH